MHSTENEMRIPKLDFYFLYANGIYTIAYTSSPLCMHWFNIQLVWWCAFDTWEREEKSEGEREREENPFLLHWKIMKIVQCDKTFLVHIIYNNGTWADCKPPPSPHQFLFHAHFNSSFTRALFQQLFYIYVYKWNEWWKYKSVRVFLFI